MNVGTNNPGAVRVRRAVTTLLLLAAPLLAQNSRVFREGSLWVEETTGTLPAGKEFRALTDLGSLQVQGTSSQVTYVVRKRAVAESEAAARKQFAQLRITTSKVGETVVLEGRVMGRSVNRMIADFTVQIPRLTQVVKAETHGGPLMLSALQGTLTGFTAGGNVKLDDLGGTVKMFTGGGLMEAGTVNGDLFLQNGGGPVTVERVSGRLAVKTGGGRVKIGTSGAATVETGAGNIEVGQCNGDLSADSGGGNITVGSVNGSMTTETGGGSVRVGSVQGNAKVVTGGGMVELWKVGQGAQVESGTGGITVQFAGGKNQFRESSLHTSMGNITVLLPRELGANLHASTEMTNGFGIRTEFPGVTITSEGGAMGPRAMFGEGPINGGGPMLRLRTTIGQIEIKKVQ